MKLNFFMRSRDIFAGAFVCMVLCLMVSVFSSCSNTKYLRPGETLYVGSKIKYVSSDSSAKSQKEVLKEELQAIILPKPNSNILGLRVKLWIYNVVGKPTGKGLRYWIRN